MTSLPLTPNYANHILVASPSSAVRQRVLESLRSLDRRVEQASGGAEALDHLENGLWQVLFLDRSLPDLNAEELSQIIRQRFPAVEIVLLDSEADARMSVAEKEPVAIPVLEPAAIESAFPSRAAVVNSILQAPLPGMIGGSWKMQPVYRAARLLARRDTTVLVTGATGSGKELVARAIHNLSPRAARWPTRRLAGSRSGSWRPFRCSHCTSCRRRTLYTSHSAKVSITPRSIPSKILDCRTQPCVGGRKTVAAELDQMGQQPRPHEVEFGPMHDCTEIGRVSASYMLRLGADEARLGRVGQFIWLRLRVQASHTDLLFRLGVEPHSVQSVQRLSLPVELISASAAAQP